MFSYFCYCLVWQIVTQLKEQGMNTELYYKNKDRGETFNIVPTSAIRYALESISSISRLLATLFNACYLQNL